MIAFTNKTNEKDVPYPLLMFLNSMTENNAFIANNFLTPFELDRITLNKYGAIQNPTMEVKQMIIGFFLLGKILCGMILLKPSGKGEYIKVNYKIIASIIWQAFMIYIKAQAKTTDPSKNDDFILKNGVKYPKKTNDIVSEDLFDHRDLMHIFQREKKWMDLITLKVGRFLKTFVELCDKHLEVKKAQEAT